MFTIKGFQILTQSYSAIIGLTWFTYFLVGNIPLKIYNKIINVTIKTELIRIQLKWWERRFYKYLIFLQQILRESKKMERSLAAVCIT